VRLSRYAGGLPKEGRKDAKIAEKGGIGCSSSLTVREQME